MATALAPIAWHTPLRLVASAGAPAGVRYVVRRRHIAGVLEEKRAQYPWLRRPLTFTGAIELLRRERIRLTRPRRRRGTLRPGDRRYLGMAFLHRGERRIALWSDVTEEQAVDVLAHELAHHWLGHLYADAPKEIIEAEAELLGERLLFGR